MKKERILRHFKRVSKFGTFVTKHINKKLGRKIKCWNRDMLDKYYYNY